MPLPSIGGKLNYNGAPVYKPQFGSVNPAQQPSGISNPALNQTSQITNEIPIWQPPSQVPQQDQGSLFNQNGNTGVSVPTWQPPAQMPNPISNPVFGMNRNQTNRYQSPSSRYVRNSMIF